MMFFGHRFNKSLTKSCCFLVTQLNSGVFFILDATRPPTSPANQQAANVHRQDANVVIRSVESSGTPNLRASEAWFEAFGGLLAAFCGLGDLFGGPWEV